MSINYTNVVFLDIPEVGEAVQYRLYGTPRVFISKILTKVEPTVNGYRAMEQGGVILAGLVETPAHQIPAQPPSPPSPPAYHPPAPTPFWGGSYPGMRFFAAMFIVFGIVSLIVVAFALLAGTPNFGLAFSALMSSVGFFITGQILGWMVNVADDMEDIRDDIQEIRRKS
jgi:hypothetical protein